MRCGYCLLNDKKLMLFVILFLFLFFLFLVPTVILSIITKVLSFFNFGARRKKKHQEMENHETYTHTKSTGKGKKIFDKNEGEYVDFEEIK